MTVPGRNRSILASLSAAPPWAGSTRPLVWAIGAGVGSALGQLLRLPSDQIKTLAACGAPAPQDKEEARAKGRDTDETVFDDMIQTQDRARAVEDLTLGRKTELDAAIGQSEGTDPPEAR